MVYETSQSIDLQITRIEKVKNVVCSIYFCSMLRTTNIFVKHLYLYSFFSGEGAANIFFFLLHLAARNGPRNCLHLYVSLSTRKVYLKRIYLSLPSIYSLLCSPVEP